MSKAEEWSWSWQRRAGCVEGTKRKPVNLNLMDQMREKVRGDEVGWVDKGPMFQGSADHSEESVLYSNVLESHGEF